MIAPDEALARLLALAAPVACETVPLAQAIGRWTAQDVRARLDRPGAALSAMDGYAIRSADLPGPLRVIGESAAGSPFAGRVGAGEAVRVFTGAPLPADSDSILVQENVERSDAVLMVRDPTIAAEHVRRRGSDFCKGDVIIDAGRPVTAPVIGLAAAAGHGSLPVRRPVRVIIASTGDELAKAGDASIPDANAPMLAALLHGWPVVLTVSPPLPDNRAALDAFFAQAQDADIVVTSGGASVGDHDLVRPALLAAGASIDFWKIAMRPGKPLLAGRLGPAVVLGLPGNPVSAFVTATLFLLPLIRHLSGAAEPAPVRRAAQLGMPLPAVGMRTDYVRGAWRDGRVVAFAGDSGMLSPLAAATLLVERPAHAPAADMGDFVNVISIA